MTFLKGSLKTKVKLNPWIRPGIRIHSLVGSFVVIASHFSFHELWAGSYFLILGKGRQTDKLLRNDLIRAAKKELSQDGFGYCITANCSMAMHWQHSGEDISIPLQSFPKVSTMESTTS